MTISITTRGIGAKYGLKGKHLERVRLSLTRLDYIQKDKQGSLQAYIQLKDLPTDVLVLRQEYSDRYYKSDPISVIGDALSELESLAGEMGEWRDNMGQYEGLNATDKYEEVETAADTLENQQSELEGVQSDLDKLDGLDEVEIAVQPPFDPYFYGHSMGRAKRLANVVADLNGTVDGLGLYKAMNDLKDELEDLIDRLNDVVSELEGVDFPSMV